MQTVILLLLLLFLLPLCIVCDAVTTQHIHAMKDSNERRKEN